MHLTNPKLDGKDLSQNKGGICKTLETREFLTQIDGATQQNAALVEETSAASESLSDQASLLQKEMAFFQTGMTDMGHNVARIKVPHSASSKPAANPVSKPSAKSSFASPGLVKIGASKGAKPKCFR